MSSPDSLADRILAVPKVHEIHGPHHEFKDGGHGFKADIEEVLHDQPLFDELVDLSAQRILDVNPILPQVIIGIANGGNPWAVAIGKKLGGNIEVIETEKDENKLALLTPLSRLLLRKILPERVVYIDDLGTTGASILPAYDQVNFKSRLVKHIPDQSVYYVTARQQRLHRLRRRKIPYVIGVDLDLRTFKNQSECETAEDGLCRNNVELIRRETST